MKIIYIKDFKVIKTELDPSDSFRLEESIREGGILSVNAKIIKCSCDTEYLNSDYLVKKEHITYGEGSSAIDHSLELALSLVKKNEIALIKIEVLGDYVHLSLSQDVVCLECEVNYDVIKNEKHVYEYEAVDKLSFGKKYKQLSVDKVNHIPKVQKEYSYPLLLSAFFLLNRAIKWLAMININDLEGEHRNCLDELKTQCYNNLCQLHLSIGNYEKTVNAAKLVLKRVPDNVKALYRRAVANINLQNYEKAQSDLELILKKEPSNTPAKKQMALLAEKNSSLNKHYSEAMKKFLAFS